MTQPQTEGWESKIKQLIEEYGTASYLVSEENHPEQEEQVAMDNCIAYIKSTIIPQAEEAERKRMQQIFVDAGFETLEQVKKEAEDEGFNVLEQEAKYTKIQCYNCEPKMRE